MRLCLLLAHILAYGHAVTLAQSRTSGTFSNGKCAHKADAHTKHRRTHALLTGEQSIHIKGTRNAQAQTKHRSIHSARAHATRVYKVHLNPDPGSSPARRCSGALCWPLWQSQHSSCLHSHHMVLGLCIVQCAQQWWPLRQQLPPICSGVLLVLVLTAWTNGHRPRVYWG